MNTTTVTTSASHVDDVGQRDPDVERGTERAPNSAMARRLVGAAWLAKLSDPATMPTLPTVSAIQISARRSRSTLRSIRHQVGALAWSWGRVFAHTWWPIERSVDRERRALICMALTVGSVGMRLLSFASQGGAHQPPRHRTSTMSGSATPT